mgnify:CR=1 FL=1
MLANKIYLNKQKSFWAQIKLVSMTLGYSQKDKIKVYTIGEIADCLQSQGLSTDHIVDTKGKPTKEGSDMVSYFIYRSKILHEAAEPNLMTREKAKVEFEKLLKVADKKLNIHIPYNKQKGDKRHYAYLTGIVNILTATTLGHTNFEHDPRTLIVISKNGKPIQTLSRRVDGAYPATKNPKAIWEIKEYYGTKTFGSRVADGVYETLLDGYEIKELTSGGGDSIGHYLIIDDYYTWWSCGKSYLCRMVDMIHAGYVDEVIFGKEVIKRWPEIVKKWPKLPSKK